MDAIRFGQSKGGVWDVTCAARARSDKATKEKSR